MDSDSLKNRFPWIRIPLDSDSLLFLIPFPFDTYFPRFRSPWITIHLNSHSLGIKFPSPFLYILFNIKIVWGQNYSIFKTNDEILITDIWHAWKLNISKNNKTKIIYYFFSWFPNECFLKFRFCEVPNYSFELFLRFFFYYFFLCLSVKKTFYKKQKHKDKSCFSNLFADIRLLPNKIA